MRLLLACLVFVLGLGLAQPASAQGFPPGPWRGVWTNAEGHEYQAELDFTMDLQGRVEGQIRWMLVRSPRHEEQARIGLRGVEHVEGAFDAATGALTLRGVRLDDPAHILALGEYRLVASPDGQFIVGLTTDQGAWVGRMELVRSGP
jgi:hypothetical protein